MLMWLLSVLGIWVFLCGLLMIAGVVGGWYMRSQGKTRTCPVCARDSLPSTWSNS